MSGATPISPTLPAEFTAMLRELGLGDLPDALASTAPEVSVRVNTAKGGAEFDGATPVGWCPEGFYLPERPLFTLDPRLHQGRYYVQEASSMFHARIVRSLGLSAPVRVLDACAAPGGKTTAVASALPSGSLIVANEYVPARAAVLKENIMKWGHPATIVTRGDTAPFASMPEAFDLIVADVPCSGEGMMRKDPKAVEQWSPRLVEECAALQRSILDNLWAALSPGGYLIYSTCTFNRREDEEQVERLIAELGAESVPVPVDPAWNISPGIDTTASCSRFIPGRTRGEGLFTALLRKPGIPSGCQLRPLRAKGPKGKKNSRPVPVPGEVRGWIRGAEEFTFSTDNERITAFPTLHLPLLEALKGRTDIIHEGIPLATLKGRDIIPAHALAMSTRCNIASFPTVETDGDTALAYLRGEAVAMPDGTPRGYVMLTFAGSPLGFVKNLGNRANNLYPQSYRIRI